MYRITICLYPDVDQGEKDYALEGITKEIKDLCDRVYPKAYAAIEVYQGTRRVHKACR